MSSEDGGEGRSSSSLIVRRSRFRPGAVRATGRAAAVAALRFAGGAAELVRGAVALALSGVLLRAVEVFFFATTLLRAAGFARRTVALDALRALAPAFGADFLAALRAIFREDAGFFAVARRRLVLRPLAAAFRPEARAAFRLAIAWSLLALPKRRGAEAGNLDSCR